MASRGGVRKGAGRKSNLTKELQKAEALTVELQQYTKGGIHKVGEHFIDLIGEELKTALDNDPDSGVRPSDRQKSRQFLIRMFMEHVPMRNMKDNPLADAFNNWNKGPNLVKVEGDVNIGVAADSPRHIEETQHNAIRGAVPTVLVGESAKVS